MYPVDIHLNEHLMTGVFFFQCYQINSKKEASGSQKKSQDKGPKPGSVKKEKAVKSEEGKDVCESYVIYQEQSCVEVGVPWGVPKQGKPDNL